MSDIFSSTTNTILDQLKQASTQTCERPWINAASTDIPRNATTHKDYNGVNILILWEAAQRQSFASPEWASFLQWGTVDAKVRRGEKGTPIVFWKILDHKEGDDPDHHRMFARTSYVFNAAQVDGWKGIAPTPRPSLAERLEIVEKYISHLGVPIQYSGDKAFYSPSGDFIRVPHEDQFVSTEAKYAVIFHEEGHATGHPSRLNRDYGKRFGDQQYARDELLAEFHAAFQCARHSISNAPRPDHAQYIKSWLRILPDDPKAVFTAASGAQKAVEWCDAQQPLRPDPTRRFPVVQTTTALTAPTA